MRLFARGIPMVGMGRGHFAFPRFRVAQIPSRSFGIVDEFKKSLDEDKELNEVKEKLKQETSYEMDDPEYHPNTMWEQWKDWYQTVQRGRAIFKFDYKYANIAMRPSLHAKMQKKERNAAEQLQAFRELTKEQKKKELEEEIERVKRGKEQSKAVEGAKRRQKWKERLEALRPEGYKTPTEQRYSDYLEEKKKKELEVIKEDETHREFMAKLKEEQEKAEQERLEEDPEYEPEESKGLQEPLFPFAPESTALVAGPEKEGWEKLKDKIKFNPRGSKLYQKGLEFKERLEDSENVVVAKTMDTMGAAADLGRAGYSKVTGESETAASLRKIKEVWPHFDTNKWWNEQVKALPAAISAFHERDFKWIQAHCAPVMFDVLCRKSDELCKSINHPNINFYPFIVTYPGSMEILNATTDDPQRPYVLCKFSMQKTAEIPRDESPLVAEANVRDPSTYQPFDYQGYFKRFDLAFINERRKKLGRVPLPELGADMARAVVFKDEARLERLQLRMRKIRGETSFHKEPERLDDLKSVKIVKAFYVMVLQYSPEQDRWLIHDFHESKFDLTF